MSKIIVLIPHYNNKEQLLCSIRSIQEKIAVDILIVDDGSSIENRPIVLELEKEYHNGIVFVELLSENRGIEHALNHGLSFIQNKNYEYIGRLDCGDLNLKDRLTKQTEYLDKNEDIFMLGSWVDYISEGREKLFTLKHPTSYEEIKKKMYFNSMFVHPSVVFRTELIDAVGFYPTKYKAAEDFAFFFKVVKKFKVENYPEVLLNYVVEENSISTKKRFLQVKNRLKIILDNFYFGYYPIVGLIRNFLLLFTSRNITTSIKKTFKK